jgi:predicted dehydrogenase
MEVVGTQGSLYISTPFKPEGSTWITLRYGDHIEQFETFGQGPYKGEIEDMEDAVLDGKPQRISLEDSRHNVALICACLASARTGSVVHLG